MFVEEYRFRVIYFLTPAKENADIFKFIQSGRHGHGDERRFSTAVNNLDRQVICKLKRGPVKKEPL